MVAYSCLTVVRKCSISWTWAERLARLMGSMDFGYSQETSKCKFHGAYRLTASFLWHDDCTLGSKERTNMFTQTNTIILWSSVNVFQWRVGPYQSLPLTSQLFFIHLVHSSQASVQDFSACCYKFRWLIIEKRREENISALGQSVTFDSSLQNDFLTSEITGIPVLVRSEISSLHHPLH